MTELSRSKRGSQAVRAWRAQAERVGVAAIAEHGGQRVFSPKSTLIPTFQLSEQSVHGGALVLHSRNGSIGVAVSSGSSTCEPGSASREEVQ